MENRPVSLSGMICESITIRIKSTTESKAVKVKTKARSFELFFEPTIDRRELIELVLNLIGSYETPLVRRRLLYLASPRRISKMPRKH